MKTKPLQTSLDFGPWIRATPRLVQLMQGRDIQQSIFNLQAVFKEGLFDRSRLWWYFSNISWLTGGESFLFRFINQY